MAAVSKLACVGRLKNQVALITGASTGIGRGIALSMAEEEADVVINFIGDGKAAHKLVDEIRRKHVRAIAIEADVSDENQVQHMFDKATRELGAVDILVNNAGIQKDAVFQEMTLTDWRKVIDVNLTGAFLCAREAVRGFKKRGIPEGSITAGKIIFISSVH